MNPVLFIVIPLLFAFISVINKKFPTLLLIVGSIVNVGMIFIVDKGLYSIGGFGKYGINLLVDQFTIVGLVIVNGLFLLTVLTNYKEVRRIGTVLLVTLAGVNGILLTNDLFNLFVFLEITGISAYLISAQSKKPLATFNYLIQGTVGSGLYLLGLILLYSVVGTLNMAQVYAKLCEYRVLDSKMVLPFMLMFVGLGVEAKLFPFNSWVKGVLDKANALTSVMIASIISSAVILTFGRLLNIVFKVEDLMTIITVILVLTIIAGEFSAFVSKNIKEVLLFSAIATSGLTILLFVNGLIIPAVMLVIANALSKFILFTLTGKIADQTKTDNIDELKGVFSNNKLIGLVYTVASLSVIGLPMFFGFIVKLNLLKDLFSLDKLLVAGIILVASLIEGTYFVRLLTKLWYGDYKKLEFNLFVKVITLIFALIIIALGIYSTPLDNLLEVIPNEFIDFLKGGAN